MRRKISLYIEGRKADLDKDSLVLLNYTMEDLYNPTIVKNSYSQQITLQGTATNNAIFGDIYRLDRVVGNNGSTIGIDFNPSRKTAFSIYNELNEVLESGYLKLNSIKRNGKIIEYNITLFGGLGAFLYALSFDEDGNRKSLADLDFLGTDNPASELDFTINVAAVSAAWATNTIAGDVDSLWKIINFAPAYNGIPEGDFAADKALVTPSSVGLQNTITEDNVTYGVKSNYSLVTLAEAHDEWEVKDLRSYLQRPVFAIRALLAAISKPENNGGYVVNMPFLNQPQFAAYKNLWVTLPLIPSIGTSKQTSGDLSLQLVNTPTSDVDVATFNVNGDVPFGTWVTAKLNIALQYANLATEQSLSSYVTTTNGRNTLGKMTVIFIQAVAHGTGDVIVGGSKVKAIYNWSYLTPKQMANAVGYTAPYENGELTFEASANRNTTFNKSGSYYKYANDLGFVVEAQDVAYYTINVTTFNVQTSLIFNSQTGAFTPSIVPLGGGSQSLAALYKDYNTPYTATNSQVIQGSSSNSISYTSAESLRSGATITKAMLLSTSKTPADYLLSFCKIFGLHIIYDKATKEITILDRTELFKDETIDLSERVDISKAIDIVPFVFNSKWYDFKLEGVGGAFMDEYKDVQGIDYGIQRVNTMYDFDADVNNILDGNVFKNAATVLAKSRYFTVITQNGQLRPSVFIDQGNKYTLWNQDDGQSKEFDIPVPTYAANVGYLNTDGHQGYDIELARKMEFRAKDGKPVDGTDVLLFLEGQVTYPYFNLTDDLPAMDLLNDGVPCWILNPGDQEGLAIPIFQRYRYNSQWVIGDSLDFGVPKELDIPQITYSIDKTLYARFWRNYLTDRFSVNSKVMTCWVNFAGMHVGYDLLRKFYWYGNSLWSLNQIKNYSLTTFDNVECEFVQVQDKDSYLVLDNSLSVNPTVLSFGYLSEHQDVHISTKGAWSIYAISDWLTSSKDEGEGNDTIRITTSRNDGDPRQGMIRIVGDDGEATINVMQARRPAVITYGVGFDGSQMNFLTAGETKILNVYGITYADGVEKSRILLTTSEYTLSGLPTWATFSNGSITAVSNPGTQRTKSITVTWTAKEESGSLTLRQMGSEAYVVEFDETTLLLSAAGESKTIKVYGAYYLGGVLQSRRELARSEITVEKTDYNQYDTSSFEDNTLVVKATNLGTTNTSPSGGSAVYTITWDENDVSSDLTVKQQVNVRSLKTAQHQVTTAYSAQRSPVTVEAVGGSSFVTGTRTYDIVSDLYEWTSGSQEGGVVLETRTEQNVNPTRMTCQGATISGNEVIIPARKHVLSEKTYVIRPYYDDVASGTLNVIQHADSYTESSEDYDYNVELGLVGADQLTAAGGTCTYEASAWHYVRPIWIWASDGQWEYKTPEAVDDQADVTLSSSQYFTLSNGVISHRDMEDHVALDVVRVIASNHSHPTTTKEREISILNELEEVNTDVFEISTYHTGKIAATGATIPINYSSKRVTGYQYTSGYPKESTTTPLTADISTSRGTLPSNTVSGEGTINLIVPANTTYDDVDINVELRKNSQLKDSLAFTQEATVPDLKQFIQMFKVNPHNDRFGTQIDNISSKYAISTVIKYHVVDSVTGEQTFPTSGDLTWSGTIQPGGHSSGPTIQRDGYSNDLVYTVESAELAQ